MYLGVVFIGVVLSPQSNSSSKCDCFRLFVKLLGFNFLDLGDGVVYLPCWSRFDILQHDLMLFLGKEYVRHELRVFLVFYIHVLLRENGRCG